MVVFSGRQQVLTVRNMVYSNSQTRSQEPYRNSVIVVSLDWKWGLKLRSGVTIEKRFMMANVWCDCRIAHSVLPLWVWIIGILEGSKICKGVWPLLHAGSQSYVHRGASKGTIQLAPYLLYAGCLAKGSISCLAQWLNATARVLLVTVSRRWSSLCRFLEP